MVKKIAVVNDISGFGKCSLTAALPVISALKVQACPLPTSVLSNQTCYSSFYIKELTEDMGGIIDKWLQLGFSFDGIYSGFLADSKQADYVIKLVDLFKKEGVKFILDPVMGDDGETYANYSPKLRSNLLYLSQKADIILPNVTELSLLCQSTPTAFTNADGTDKAESIEKAALDFYNKFNTCVVVTGVSTMENDVPYLSNIIANENGIGYVKRKRLKGGYSGTGDIMASIVSAMAVRGFDIKKAVDAAADFILKAAEDTSKEDTDVNDGVNFEKFLSLLTDI